MISLPYVESAAIRLHTLDHGRHENIWVGVSISVGVGGKIVRDQVASDLEVLRNRLAVISRYTWRKVLWGLDASRSRLDGQAGNRNRSAGSSRICIQSFIANQHSLCRIRRQNVPFLDVCSYCDSLLFSRNLEFDANSQRLRPTDKKALADGFESCDNQLQGIFPRCYPSEGKLTLVACESSLNDLIFRLARVTAA